MIWLILLVLFVIGAVFLYVQAEKARRERLMAKYRDEKLVDMIMRKMFWQGQTAEQLRDSLGKPASMDRKVLKTKTKEIWKYNHQGGNRYNLRITVEDDEVVGWDKKGG